MIDRDVCQVLSYGGGRQTVAMCILIEREILPRPDRIVIADTGREKSSTWEYLDCYVRPMLAKIGLAVEIAPRELSKVDLYAHNGDLLLPVYTATGKLKAFCSNEWKAYVVQRHLRATGTTAANCWIGFALDETDRIKKDKAGPWSKSYPLAELMLTKEICRKVIVDRGWDMPLSSACWMCPNLENAEWREVRDLYPADFEAACVLDEEVREEDLARGNGGVWLHSSRVPLRKADLSVNDRREGSKQCSFGGCFV